MNNYALALLIGIVIFAAGWAVRSTYIMHGFVNKPIGGALICLGFFVIGISLWRIIKNR